MRQLVEGVIFGAAARRLRSKAVKGDSNGRLTRLDPEVAYPAMAEVARSRLSSGLALIRGGSDSSLIPQRPLTWVVRAAFVVLLVGALVATAFAFVHGYQTPAVPQLTIPRGPG